MIRTIALLLLSVLLVLPQPSAALDLQGLYEQALTASRRGDFAEALPLWDQVLCTVLMMRHLEQSRQRSPGPG